MKERRKGWLKEGNERRKERLDEGKKWARGEKERRPSDRRQKKTEERREELKEESEGVKGEE